MGFLHAERTAARRLYHHWSDPLAFYVIVVASLNIVVVYIAVDCHLVDCSSVLYHTSDTVTFCWSKFCSCRTTFIGLLINLLDFIRRRHPSVFSHIARLTTGIPAYVVPYCQVGLSSGPLLGRDCRDVPGCPRSRWTDQFRIGPGLVPASLWRLYCKATMKRRNGPSSMAM